MIPVRDEAVRKGMHLLLSLVAAAVAWFLPPTAAAIVLAAATGVALTVELARRASAPFARFFARTAGPLLREREATRLTGATTLALGYTAAVLLFPGRPAAVGILVAGVADAAAAVIGKRFGGVRYPGGKSPAGSAAFFLVVVIVLALALPGWAPAPLLAAAILLTLVEAPTLPVDDNLYLPGIAAAVVRITQGLTALAFFS